MEEEIKKHPGVAAVLSFVFNGLGQLYNGHLVKGLVIIFFSALALLVVLLGAILIGFWLLGKNFFCGQLISGGILLVVGVFVIGILGIYSIFDAYKVASKK